MDIQIKRGTAKARKSCADVLKDGQPFLEKDTGVLYMGDGETQLKDLVPIYPANLYEHTIKIRIYDNTNGFSYSAKTPLQMWLELRLDSSKRDCLIASQDGVQGESINLSRLRELLQSGRGQLSGFFHAFGFNPSDLTGDRYPIEIPRDVVGLKDDTVTIEGRDFNCLTLAQVKVPTTVKVSEETRVYMKTRVPASGNSFVEPIDWVWEEVRSKQPDFAELSWVDQELT